MLIAVAGIAISAAATTILVMLFRNSDDFVLVIDHSSVVAGRNDFTHNTASTDVKRTVYNTYCARYNKLRARTTENRAVR